MSDSCPLCGCDLECRGCYCHEDPEDKSCKAGAAAEHERIISAMRRVHRQSTLSEHCVNCQFAWPCPTEQALASLDAP
jgi:hypothetical protein